MRGLVIDELGGIEWIDSVNLDKELPQFGLREGVHTFGDCITCPSLVKVHALHQILTKLATFGAQKDVFFGQAGSGNWMSRIAVVSGAASPSTHFLSAEFESTLESLYASCSQPVTNRSRVASLPESLPPSAFSLPTPPTSQDTSTSSHCRQLENAFGQTAVNRNGVYRPPQSTKTNDARKVGAQEMAKRVGRRAQLGSMAAQLTKLRANGWQNVGEGAFDDKSANVLGQTARICLESNLLASLFLGKLAPIDSADAGSTGLFNLEQLDWDEQMLRLVMGNTSRVHTGGAELRSLLGSVNLDGGALLGSIAPYLVARYGFSTECKVNTFTGNMAASALAHPLSTNLQPDYDRPSVLACLSVDERDSVVVQVSSLVSDVSWEINVHPARAPGKEKSHEEESVKFFVVIRNETASLGRSLVRDLYANGSWAVFSDLVAIVPHGGSIGLDDKCFAMFHTQGPSRGLIRFVQGLRVNEFEDRKVNPRLIIEGQALAIRHRLSRLASLLPTSTATPPSAGILSFDPYDHSLLPESVLVTGGGSANAGLLMILGSVLGADVLGKVELIPASATGVGGGTTSSSLGAAKKARWAWARTKSGLEGVSFEDWEERVRVTIEQAGESESFANEEVGELVLVASPGENETDYYGSMLAEWVRLESAVAKGVL